MPRALAECVPTAETPARRQPVFGALSILLWGVYRRMAITLGDLPVSMTVAADGSLECLATTVRERTAREKYRRRTPKALGLGIHHGLRARPFHTYSWREGEWTADEAMERELAWAERPMCLW